MEGDGEKLIFRPVPADSADSNGITFAENEKYLAAALASGAGAVIVPAETPSIAKTAIRVVSPRVAFGQVLAAFVIPMPAAGIHPTAQIADDAQIDPTASIGPYAVVESRAVIGANTNVMAHCYLGPECQVGSDCELFPGVVLVQSVTVGDRCRIHANTVLGADGFGFVWNGSFQQKVPQVGVVVIGNDVEIGANSCVDRATCGATMVADGVKLDNLVQIGHNVRVGQHTVMAAQVGIGGSTIIGERNVFGGQSATSDHVTVGSDMVFGGRSGIMGSMDQPGEYYGAPPVPISTAMRVLALQARLPDLFKRIRALENELERLKNGTHVPKADNQD